MLDFDQVV